MASTNIWNGSTISPLNNTCDIIQLPAPLGDIPRWGLFALLVGIMMVTVVSNIYVIIRINRLGTHKPVTRFYITSLSCVDLSVGLFIMPYQIVNITFPTFGQFRYDICDVMNSLDVCLSSASIIHLSILTFERYVALCHSFQYPKWCGTLNMATVYVTFWILTSAVSFGLIIPGYGEYGVDDVILSCFEGFMKAGANCIFTVGVFYMALTSSVTILLPIVFTVCLNFRVLAYIQHASQEMASYGTTSHKHRQKIKVSRTLAILTGCFLFCWCPFFISNTICVMLNYAFPYDVMTVVTWIGYVNSGANPLLYMYFQRTSSVSKSYTLAREVSSKE